MGHIPNRQLLVFSERGQLSQAIILKLHVECYTNEFRKRQLRGAIIFCSQFLCPLTPFWCPLTFLCPPPPNQQSDGFSSSISIKKDLKQNCEHPAQIANKQNYEQTGVSENWERKKQTNRKTQQKSSQDCSGIFWALLFTCFFSPTRNDPPKKTHKQTFATHPVLAQSRKFVCAYAFLLSLIERQSRNFNHGTTKFNARYMRTNLCVWEGDMTANKWAVIWGGAKRMGGGKRTRERALPKIVGPLQKSFWSALSWISVQEKQSTDMMSHLRGVENVSVRGGVQNPLCGGVSFVRLSTLLFFHPPMASSETNARDSNRCDSAITVARRRLSKLRSHPRLCC